MGRVEGLGLGRATEGEAAQLSSPKVLGSNHIGGQRLDGERDSLQEAAMQIASILKSKREDTHCKGQKHFLKV